MKSIFLASLCLISSALMITSCSNGDYTANPGKSGASNPIYQPTPIGVNVTGGNGNGSGGNGGGYSIAGGSFTWSQGGTNYTSNTAYAIDTTAGGVHLFELVGIQGLTNASNLQGKYILVQIANYASSTTTYSLGGVASSGVAAAYYYDVASATSQKIYIATTGTLKITSDGGKGNYIQGTISFDAESAADTTQKVTVTNGQFKLKRY